MSVDRQGLSRGIEMRGAGVLAAKRRAGRKGMRLLRLTSECAAPARRGFAETTDASLDAPGRDFLEQHPTCNVVRCHPAEALPAGVGG